MKEGLLLNRIHVQRANLSVRVRFKFPADVLPHTAKSEIPLTDLAAMRAKVAPHRPNLGRPQHGIVQFTHLLLHGVAPAAPCFTFLMVNLMT